MAIRDRIESVCRKHNEVGKGVLNPRVCPFCFGCPLATIVVGVSGRNNQTSARPIPEADQPGVNLWLDKIEAK